MNKIHFVFCHGFGFDANFWNKLAPFFANEHCSFIDLGYFNNPMTLPKFKTEKVVGIGHSLGLLKLIELYQNFSCLIGLNSFIDFLGSEQTLRLKRTIELRALQQRFLNSPIDALIKFYLQSGAQELIKKFTNVNLDLILADLNYLKKPYLIPQIPILILSAKNDLITPWNLLKDNFSNHPKIKLDLLNYGGHALGFTKPLVTYIKIKRFLYEVFK